MGSILIFKIISWVAAIAFAVVVLAVTADKLRDGDACGFGITKDSLRGKEEACNLALAVGAIGMVVGIIGLILEFVVEKGGAVMIVIKKFIFLGLMIAAILTAVLWIATFVYLIYLWEEETPYKSEIEDSARAVLAFSFLSVGVQVVVAVLEKIDHGNALSVPIP